MSIQTDIGRQGKFILLAVVGTVGAVGYILYTYWTDKSQPVSQITLPSNMQNAQGSTTQEDPRYAALLKQYNDMKAREANQRGDSFIGTPSMQPRKIEASAPSGQPSEPTNQITHEQRAQQAPQQQQQMSGELSKKLDALLEIWTPGIATSARVTEEKTYRESLMKVSANGHSSNSSPTSAPARRVIPDFTLVAAVLDVDIDTDENSLVEAHVPSGPYAGLRVYATGGYKRINNTVDMTFDAMEWNGRSYKVTAKVVDPSTMRSGLSGEVNNRWFTRIVLPAIATGIGQTGQLYAQSNAQNIITPQGGVVQTYPSTPNATAVAGTIIGGMGQQAGQVLTNDAANTPTKQVLISKGHTIGIRFIGPVLSSDEITGQGGKTGGNLDAISQQAGQPQQTHRVAPTPSGYSMAPGLYYPSSSSNQQR
ncbi:hypothetical protein CEK28_08860 [Xenophilus sp. AP218F]|nr:hypothetical protein CEK28_08860 [Xenophilus sp. AP218F]